MRENYDKFNFYNEDGTPVKRIIKKSPVKRAAPIKIDGTPGNWKKNHDKKGKRIIL